MSKQEMTSRKFHFTTKNIRSLQLHDRNSPSTDQKLLTGFAVSLMASLIISGAALAAGGAQTGDRDGTPDQDRDRDGSCLDAVEQNNTSLLLVRKGKGTGDKDGTPDRDRKRDGSCLKG